MTPSQIIVLATPVFLGLIGLEAFVGWRRGRNGYRLADAVNSIGLGIISQLAGVFAKAFTIGIYAWAFDHLALAHWPVDAWWTWVVGLLGYDLCYYWLHRGGHRVGVLWAAHVVHHQSEDYNLSTALRQTGTGFLLGWVFYLPLAVAGLPPLVFGVVALIDLLYQFWVHTEQVGRLGGFDRWFCSPSNHRVHHAVNEKYLDRNYGGILMVWDRMFGTFIDEDATEPCVYGTRKPLRSWNPVWANLEVYAALAKDSLATRRWRDKLRLWWAPPGWRPSDLAAAQPVADFDLAGFRKFDPPPFPAARWLTLPGFVALLGLTSLLLWNAHTLATSTLVVGSLVVTTGLWALGRLHEGPAGRSPPREAPDTNLG